VGHLERPRRSIGGLSIRNWQIARLFGLGGFTDFGRDHADHRTALRPWTAQPARHDDGHCPVRAAPVSDRGGQGAPEASVIGYRGLIQRPQLAPEVDIGRRPAASHIGNLICGRILGVRLSKERKDSPRRIDAAVAAVMAHDRATALADMTRDSIYL
jgi:hypothetical protein